MPALHRANSELTIAEIAELTGAQPLQRGPSDRRIRNIAPLDAAGAVDISFLDSEKHLGELATTHAGACFMSARFSSSAPPDVVVLLTEAPYAAFVAVARALFPASLHPSSLFEGSGRASGARVHPSARIEAGVTIDPLAVIGPRAKIGGGALIAAGAAIGPDVCIGRHCAVGAGATILNALIGDRVVVHPGVRIGHDGFDYLPGPNGHQKVPQTRRVIIQDDVVIGANATIDRGSTRDTVIGEGTKIDNLVQIAHNVSIGRHCLIAAQAGFGAGATLGDFVVIGARVGIGGDVTIGDGARLAGASELTSDVAADARAAPRRSVSNSCRSHGDAA